MKNRKCFLLCLVVALCCLIHNISLAQFLSPTDVNELPSAPPDHRISYGSDPLQFGDLRLPDGQGPHPVAIIIHGGCWLSKFADLQNTAALSDALRRIGIATWNIEYRRVDNPGGGWPGTFLDVASAADYLRDIAKEYKLDLKRVIAIGHSSGGHLAMWVAARHRIPKESPLYIKNPLPMQGVVALGAPSNLKWLVDMDETICGEHVITKLLGGLPDVVPERFQQISPIELLPTGIPQILITGALDTPMLLEDGKAYEETAKRKGDRVQFKVVEHASHHEVVAPGSSAWLTVRSSILSQLGIERH